MDLRFIATCEHRHRLLTFTHKAGLRGINDNLEIPRTHCNIS